MSFHVSLHQTHSDYSFGLLQPQKHFACTADEGLLFKMKLCILCQLLVHLQYLLVLLPGFLSSDTDPRGKKGIMIGSFRIELWKLFWSRSAGSLLLAATHQALPFLEDQTTEM